MYTVTHILDRFLQYALMYYYTHKHRNRFLPKQVVSYILFPSALALLLRQTQVEIVNLRPIAETVKAKSEGSTSTASFSHSSRCEFLPLL